MVIRLGLLVGSAVILCRVERRVCGTLAAIQILVVDHLQESVVSRLSDALLLSCHVFLECFFGGQFSALEGDEEVSMVH